MSRESRLQMSLGLNVILAIAIGALLLYKPKPVPAPSAGDSNTAKMKNEPPANERPVAIVQPKLPRYSDAASPSDQRRWLVDQLRAAGVPNSVVARVVMSDLDESWDKRFAELGKNGRADADSMAAFQLEQEKDKEAQMRAALGEGGFKEWDQGNMLREANIGKIQLTASESDAIYDLKKKLQERQRDMAEARLKGTMDDTEINSATDKAYSEFNQQMKTLLGDARYAESQGVGESTVATNLLRDLAKANPSDSQFQDLLKAQQDWNQRRADLDKQFQDNPSSTAYSDQVRALDEARDQQYQRVLGTNVFDSLQKEQDPGYTKMKKCETIWGLDDGKIDYVYGTIKFYEKSVQDYQAQARALETQGQNVDWDAVNKNLQVFAQQTQQALQTYLGQDSFDKLKQNSVFQFNQPNPSLHHAPPQ